MIIKVGCVIRTSQWLKGDLAQRVNCNYIVSFIADSNRQSGRFEARMKDEGGELKSQKLNSKNSLPYPMRHTIRRTLRRHVSDCKRIFYLYTILETDDYIVLSGNESYIFISDIT